MTETSEPDFKVYDREGTEIVTGVTIKTFRGDRYIFEGISRVPATSGGGKILAGGREWYPAVFRLEIRRDEQGAVRA